MPHPLTPLCKCDRCETLAFMKANAERFFADAIPSAKISGKKFFKKHYNLNLNLGIDEIERPHYFVTVSLPPKTFNEIEMIDKLKSLKYLQDDTYGVFEYEPHPHIHLLCLHKYVNKYNIIKSFSKKLDLNKNFIDVKYSTSPDLYETRKDYVLGIKQKDKQDVVQRDKEYKVNNEKILYFRINENKISIY